MHVCSLFIAKNTTKNYFAMMYYIYITTFNYYFCMIFFNIKVTTENITDLVQFDYRFYM